MKNVEFYTARVDVMYITEDGEHHHLTEDSKEPIRFLLEKFRAFYPDCMAACEEKYKRCRPNHKYYEFKIANRICKCNFGNLAPHRTDVDESGCFHFEDVPCPLRGECEHENIICHPRFESGISKSEMQVLRLLYDGFTRPEIVKELCSSPCTIDNHIQNMLVRLGLHKETQLLAYARKHNIFR